MKQLCGAGPISTGVGKVQICIVGQGIQDCNPCPQEFGTLRVQRCHGGKAQGWERAWAVPNTQWDTAGGMFYVTGISCCSCIHLQRRDIAPGPPVLPQVIYQTKMHLCGQSEISFMETHTGTSQYERFPFSLKLFCISFPYVSFSLV